ncbi:MAG: hypothetical protein Q9164_006561 [Protoblastenia rupestris]
MTTAHRPTFDPRRKAGQGGDADSQPHDLKAQLLEAEAAHFSKNPSAAKPTTVLTPNKRLLEEGPGQDSQDEEDLETKKRRVLEETRDIDAASDDSGIESSEEDSDEEDETAELLRELEKIKRERAEKKEQEEREKATAEQEQRQSDIALGNPLLMPDRDTETKRRWDDDVVFRNQARGTEKKGKPEFINDLLRSDFHKRFMVFRLLLIYFALKLNLGRADTSGKERRIVVATAAVALATTEMIPVVAWEAPVAWVAMTAAMAYVPAFLDFVPTSSDLTSRALTVWADLVVWVALTPMVYARLPQHKIAQAKLTIPQSSDRMGGSDSYGSGNTSGGMGGSDSYGSGNTSRGMGGDSYGSNTDSSYGSGTVGGAGSGNKMTSGMQSTSEGLGSDYGSGSGGYGGSSGDSRSSDAYSGSNDYGSGATGGAGSGNKMSSGFGDNDNDNTSGSYGGDSRSNDAYSGSTGYGSGATGGAGSGNKMSSGYGDNDDSSGGKKDSTMGKLMEKAGDIDVAQLIRRFENIIAYLPDEKSDRNIAAVNAYQMGVETAALVRAAEDILSLTRVLKEAWLFGKLQTVGTSEAEKRTEIAAGNVAEALTRLSAAGAFDVVSNTNSGQVNGQGKQDEKDEAS